MPQLTSEAQPRQGPSFAPTRQLCLRQQQLRLGAGELSGGAAVDRGMRWRRPRSWQGRFRLKGSWQGLAGQWPNGRSQQMDLASGRPVIFDQDLVPARVDLPGCTCQG